MLGLEDIFNNPLFPFAAIIMLTIFLRSYGIEQLLAMLRNRKQTASLKFLPVNEDVEQLVDMQAFKGLHFDGISEPHAVKFIPGEDPVYAFNVIGSNKELGLVWEEPTDTEHFKYTNIEGMLSRTGARWKILSDGKDLQLHRAEVMAAQINALMKEGELSTTDYYHKMLAEGKMIDIMSKYIAKQIITPKTKGEHEGTTIEVKGTEASPSEEGGGGAD